MKSIFLFIRLSIQRGITGVFPAVAAVVLSHLYLSQIRPWAGLTQLTRLTMLTSPTNISFSIRANVICEISLLILITPPSTSGLVLESHRGLCLDRHHFTSKESTGPNRAQCSSYHSEAQLLGWSASSTAHHTLVDSLCCNCVVQISPGRMSQKQKPSPPLCPLAEQDVNGLPASSRLFLCCHHLLLAGVSCPASAQEDIPVCIPERTDYFLATNLKIMSREPRRKPSGCLQPDVTN